MRVGSDAAERRIRPTMSASGSDTVIHRITSVKISRIPTTPSAPGDCSTLRAFGTFRRGAGAPRRTRKDVRMPRVTAAMVASGRAVAEPRLSPDGRHLAFVATEDGRSRLVVVDAAGGPERVLTTDPAPLPG